MDELRRDLGIWVQKLADDAVWQPEYFEFSFGLSDEGRDPRSLAGAILVDGRFLLRGSVDLIERKAGEDTLRVTDHKTGKNRSNPDLIVGAGKVLQPVLYSVAVEQGLGRKVEEGRLFYCTTAGGFTQHSIAIDDYNRGQGLAALTIIDRSVELGFLPAAPDKDGCRWCDFRAVCGPREEERVAREKAGSAGRPRGAEVDAMTLSRVTTGPTHWPATPSGSRSTTRWWSRPPREPARPPSS